MVRWPIEDMPPTFYFSNYRAMNWKLKLAQGPQVQQARDMHCQRSFGPLWLQL